MRYDEDVKFSAGPSSGSLGTQRTCPAMIGAARKLKQVILEYASQPALRPSMEERGQPAIFLDKKPEELEIKDSMVFEKANPPRKAKVADVMRPFFNGLGSPFFAWDFPPSRARDSSQPWEGLTMYIMARQCYFIEVEVDPETGMVEITKLVAVNDVGKAINPDAINGQQYGGSYMGIGRSNTEAIYCDPHTGVKLNDNHLGYAILTMNDVGPISCHILESGLGYGPYGVYGIGESSAACTTTITGPAIYNAIGKWVTDFPTTPDKILKALGKI